MKKLINTLFAIILITIMFGCDDILEEDLTNDIVQIISPNEGDIIEGNTVNFTWQHLDGADDYRIQIINSDLVYVTDSLVSSNSFSKILNPDTYQWRVRGENFAYETSFNFPINFSVETTTDLSSQTLLLDTPSDNIYTNDVNIIFTWFSLINADTYSFELLKTFGGLQTVYQEENIIATSRSIDAINFSEDSEYIWKVKALNTTSATETPYSERSIFIDRVVPNLPSLITPADLEVVTSIVDFSWSNGTDSGNVQSLITNKIEIALDINFNTIINSHETINNTYQYEFTDLGNYYWRVKAIDEAQNESDYSIVRLITVE